jgi:RimJ/RimL family protein N-acetyltransferase
MAEDRGPVFAGAPPERIELSGGRALARWTAERAASAAASVNESLEHLQPWMAWAQEPATEAGMATFLAVGERLWDLRRDFGYSVIEGPEERVVGGCGLHGRHDEHALEIGYWVHVDSAGLGLATELSQALTDAAFEIPGIEHVHIKCAEQNVRSARVPEKLGFTFLGVRVPDEGVCAGRPTMAFVVERRAWIARRAEAAS